MKRAQNEHVDLFVLLKNNTLHPVVFCWQFKNETGRWTDRRYSTSDTI
jgi:hypothetical protein